MKKTVLIISFLCTMHSLFSDTGTMTRMSQRAANAIEQALTENPEALTSQVNLLIEELSKVVSRLGELSSSLCQVSVIEPSVVISCLQKEAELSGLIVEQQMLRTSLANFGLQSEVEKLDKLMTDAANDVVAQRAIYVSKLSPNQITPTLQLLNQGLQNPELYAGQVNELGSIIQMLMQRIDRMKNNSCRNVNLDVQELTSCIKNEAEVAGLEAQLLVLQTGLATLTTRTKDKNAASRAQDDVSGIGVQQEVLRESGIPGSQIIPLLPAGLSNELIPMGKY